MEKKTLIIFVLILMLGLALRVAHMGRLHTVEPDEYSWLFAGTSLLAHGVPTSWTIQWPFYDWRLYKNIDQKHIRANTYKLVTPWLDHPPLFAVAIAAWTQLVPTGSLEDPNWTLVRLPMIAVALLAMAATGVLAYEAGGKRYALFTAAAYTFFPAAALSAPFIMAEQAVTAWLAAGLLAAYWAVWGRSDTIRDYARMALFFIVATAPWLKLSGIVVPITLVIALWLWRQYALAAKIMIIAGVALAAFIAYGTAYNSDLFFGTQRAHALRPQSFNNFWSLFSQREVAKISVTDPSIVVGFIGVFMMASAASRKVKPLLIAGLVAGVGILLLVAPVEAYSWYKFPLYPMIALGLGWVLYQFYRGEILFAALVLPLLVYVGEQAHPAIAGSRKIFLLSISILFGVWMIFPRNAVGARRIVAGSLLVLLFALEALWILNVGNG